MLAPEIDEEHISALDGMRNAADSLDALARADEDYFNKFVLVRLRVAAVGLLFYENALASLKDVVCLIYLHIASSLF
jgi:hypothetical protein